MEIGSTCQMFLLQNISTLKTFPFAHVCRHISNSDLDTTLAVCKPQICDGRLQTCFLLLPLLALLCFLVVVSPVFADQRFPKNIFHDTSQLCQGQKVLENSKCFPALLNTYQECRQPPCFSLSFRIASGLSGMAPDGADPRQEESSSPWEQHSNSILGLDMERRYAVQSSFLQQLENLTIFSDYLH